MAAGKSEAPRCAYYIFPHVALRQFAFGNPYLCMGALGSAEEPRFLNDLLQAVAEYCGGMGEETTLRAEDIRVHHFRANKLPCLIAEMPAPRAATEVFFVGIVLKPPAGDTAADLVGVEVRYFTLEKGVSADGGDKTVLGEWTTDNRRVNHGDGPVPDVKKFLKVLAEKCG